MNVRLATPEDIPAIAAVLEASDESAAWPGLPGWPYVEHLVTRARVLVALEAEEIVGMAGSIEVGRPDVRFLTDLFVRPDRQDHGIGRALLGAAFEGTTERLTFSSADPRALGAYIRAGLRPWWPVLYLEVPGGALSDPDPQGDEPVAARPADVATTAAWSRAWTGMDRTVDFAHYAGLPDAAGHVVMDGDAAVAIVWSNRGRTRPIRVADHVSIAPEADPQRAALGALRVAIGRAEALSVTIPGPHPAVSWLLDRGARIVGHDQFCATDPALLDPVRILPSPGFL